VHSDATRRDDRQHDSTHGTDKLACSQSQSPVTLNRDTIVPDFVILANPLNSCALTRLSTSRRGGSSNVLLRRWLRLRLSVVCFDAAPPSVLTISSPPPSLPSPINGWLHDLLSSHILRCPDVIPHRNSSNILHDVMPGSFLKRSALQSR